MRLLFVLFSLLCAVSAEPPNMILGTQAIGGRYHFTEEEPLLESAKIIAEIGSDVMKFSVSTKDLPTTSETPFIRSPIISALLNRGVRKAG